MGRVREGRGRSRPNAERGAVAECSAVPLAGSFSESWLRAAGAGGTGRRGLGPGRLPSGAPRVGAEHPWGWMGARGGLRVLRGRVGAKLGQSWRGAREGSGARLEGSPHADEMGVVYWGQMWVRCPRVRP